MKIALCLHGLVGTKNKYGIGEKEPIDIKIGFSHFKKHVLNTNDHVDIFFHTWSTDFAEDLAKLYKPIACKTENQPIFSKKTREQAIRCRWRSARESVALVNDSKKQYDFILLTRFDIAFLVDFNFKNFNRDFFYTAGPPGPYQNGVAIINDLWFVANQENMTKFATLDEKIHEPSYQKYLDSNHELAKIHLRYIGLENKLKFKFKKGWSAPHDLKNCDTPLIRWHYYDKK